MDIIKKAENFAKKEYAKHDSFHQWAHVEDVMKVALKLAESYPEVDIEILKLSVILHDVIYLDKETHVEMSAKAAETFLIKEGYPEDRVKRIVNIIISHSGLYRRKHGDSDIIEAKILYDADRFGWAQSSEGFERYFQMFYLKETKKLLKKKCPELFK